MMPKWIVAASLLVVPAALAAQYGLTPETTGAMHATAETCGDYTAAQLVKLKAQDRKQGLGRGMSAAAYDAAFNRGYQSARARIAKASPADKAEHCRRARTLLQGGAR